AVARRGERRGHVTDVPDVGERAADDQRDLLAGVDRHGGRRIHVDREEVPGFGLLHAAAHRESFPVSQRRPYTEGLTTRSGHSPRRIAAACRLATRADSVADSVDSPAACGVAITFGKRSSGLAGSVGSCSNTSSPAPAIQPDSRARVSAVSSTTPPRQQLTRYAVRFNARSARSPIRCPVSWFSGTWTDPQSDTPSSAWRSPTIRTPSSRGTCSSTYGSWAMMRSPNGWRRRASAWPIAPRPTRPAVSPSSGEIGRPAGRSHTP